MKKLAIVAAAVLCISGCATMFSMEPLRTSQTSGEMESGYTYVPIDPFAVQTVPGAGCPGGGSASGYVEIPQGQLLDALPDNAVRMLVERFDLKGNISYGASKTGMKGEFYRVTIDYINAETINVTMKIAKFMRPKATGNEGKDKIEYKQVDLFSTPGPEFEPGSEVYSVSRVVVGEENKIEYEPFNIPVYVGIGLRISANVYVVGASANISGIGIIGAEAEAERVKGSLVVQTLGVNGKSITAALPIQSELNRTTAQNAIVAIGSIKALLYADETVKSPRLVGLYLPFPGGKRLVNALISELSKKPVKWEYPCRKQSQPLSK
jgi:hypothetical protein